MSLSIVSVSYELCDPGHFSCHVLQLRSKTWTKLSRVGLLLGFIGLWEKYYVLWVSAFQQYGFENDFSQCLNRLAWKRHFFLGRGKDVNARSGTLSLGVSQAGAFQV